MSITITQTPVNKNEEWLNSSNITIDTFSLSIANNKLFDDTALNIKNNKYGFLGHNGEGKSTLLTAIYNRQFVTPPSLSIFYVEQELLQDKLTAVQAVVQADIKNISLLKKEKELAYQLELDEKVREHRNSDDDILAEMEKISEELNVSNIEAMEPKARKILHGLGFTEEMQDKQVTHFSGGWQMRISLARGLFMEPQLLLLDEPTNHLDLNAVIWLKNYLIEWNKGLILVSHDQDFISTTCDNIIHLESKQLSYYACNFNKFCKMYQQKRKQYEKLWDNYLKKVKNIKKKGKYNKNNEKEYRRAKINGESIILQKPEKDYVVDFNFNEPYRMNSDIITAKDISFAYDDSDPLFENVDFSVNMNDRIVIVGPNGVGKSTFLKLITNELEPSEGDVEFNRRTRLGVYNQHFMDKLPMNKTPVEYLMGQATTFSDEQEFKMQDARKLLGRFGLKGNTHVLRMDKLSGGQKARVVFASLYIENPHIILLDEPTNNLDIESVDALITAINNFEGGVIIITHDIKLIEQTNCQLYICDKRTISKYDGDIFDYETEIMNEMST
jgi:ATP-binding cassette, subfamily F, member 1